ALKPSLGPQCIASFDKYLIEYQSERSVDRVLYGLMFGRQIASGGNVVMAMRSDKSVDPSRGRSALSLQDLQETIDRTGVQMAGIPKTAQEVFELDRKLRAWASESFKQKRSR